MQATYLFCIIQEAPKYNALNLFRKYFAKSKKFPAFTTKFLLVQYFYS